MTARTPTHIPNQTPVPGVERRFVAAAAATTAAAVWIHALAALLRPLGPADPPLAAGALTVAAIAVSLVAVVPRGRLAPVAAAMAGLVAATLVERTAPGVGPAALSLGIVGPAASIGAHALARRLPAGLDGLRLHRPATAVLWALLALLSVVQVGRLSSHMADPGESGWFLSTGHPFWARHECLNAYVYGAELAARGVDNLYADHHYPALDPAAEPTTAMAGMTVEDPYQYPPQFLLLPRLAVALSGDYVTVRVVWFALQATLFAAVALALALWVGGAAGGLAAWLFPLALTAFPTLHALQYGQFHLAAVALSVAAMLAFTRGRRATGGLMLAAAVLSKLFPALLLVALAARRRWRELAWTGSAMAAMTALALALFGIAPFVAFLDHQLPRLASGAAFDFSQAPAEIRDLLLADNQGVRGLVDKLVALGVPGLDGAAARSAGLAFGVLALALAAGLGLAEERLSRHRRAVAWLGLLGLGSLASGGAWGDYVPLTAAWLLTLLAGRLRPFGPAAGALATCWLFQYFILGTAPIGSWAPAGVMVPLSAVGAALLLGLFGWAAAAPVLAAGLRLRPAAPPHRGSGAARPAGAPPHRASARRANSRA